MASDQDAVALLKADHRAVEEPFEKFEKANGSGRAEELMAEGEAGTLPPPETSTMEPTA